MLGAVLESDDDGHRKLLFLNDDSAKFAEALKEKIFEKIKRKIGNYLYSNCSIFISIGTV